MLNSQRTPIPVVIVGAGPYGLSLASHLRAKGVPFRIFGKPMLHWETQMPPGLSLQSNGFGSNLSTGGAPYMLAQFCQETGRAKVDGNLQVTVEDFTAYGREFARRFVSNLETEEITAIRHIENLFRITTARGEQFFATRVVLATGVSLFQTVPAEFRHLPAARISDPALHASFQTFAGRDVTVLGRGASSLNTAVRLHEAGACVTLITHGRKLHLQQESDPQARPLFWRVLQPSTPLGTGLRPLLACKAPDLLHVLPPPVRRVVEHKLVEPAGGAALKGRINGFQILLGCRIHAIETASGSGDRIRLTLTDGDGHERRHLTSHLIAGTGYRIDMNRLRFLSPEIRDLIRTDAAGAPRLTHSFESSVRRLHLVGPVAAPSFGPLLRFVAGSGFASERLSLHLQRNWLRERRQAPAHEATALPGPTEAAVLARHR